MSKNNQTALLTTVVMACICTAVMITNPVKWDDGKGEPGVTAYLEIQNFIDECDWVVKRGGALACSKGNVAYFPYCSVCNKL